MRWVPDRTGRFAHRPYWLAKELDTDCELAVTSFLRTRHGFLISGSRSLDEGNLHPRLPSAMRPTWTPTVDETWRAAMVRFPLTDVEASPHTRQRLVGYVFSGPEGGFVDDC